MVDEKVDAALARREADRKKFKVGLVLFAVYIIGYALFTLAGTFFREILTLRLGGLNLGVLSGMTLIISAIVIAVLYNWFAGKMEEG
jgi:uncharacterized membrane protein (DUF485 family)